MSQSNNIQERLVEFRTRNHSLRVSASRIAAMTGFHPFCVLPELLVELIYQEFPDVFQNDVKLLGISIQTEEEQLQELAKKASKSTQDALKQALDVKRGKQRLETTEKALQVKQLVVQEAKSSKKLSENELKLLQEGVRSTIDTTFGQHHEDEALDLFEKSCGWQVRERNMNIMAWPFIKSEDCTEPSNVPTVVPMAEATTARRIMRPPKRKRSGEETKPPPKGTTNASGDSNIEVIEGSKVSHNNECDAKEVGEGEQALVAGLLKEVEIRSNGFIAFHQGITILIHGIQRQRFGCIQDSLESNGVETFDALFLGLIIRVLLLITVVGSFEFLRIALQGRCKVDVAAAAATRGRSRRRRSWGRRRQANLAILMKLQGPRLRKSHRQDRKIMAFNQFLGYKVEVFGQETKGSLGIDRFRHGITAFVIRWDFTHAFRMSGVEVGQGPTEDYQ